MWPRGFRRRTEVSRGGQRFEEVEEAMDSGNAIM